MKRKRLRIVNKFRFSIFLTVVCLIFISTIGTVLGLNTAESAQEAAYMEISVNSGDTLWGIAKKYGPNHEDPRKIIFEISKINQLDEDYLQQGQVLKIPIYD
jgi:LysM repeat protein